MKFLERIPGTRTRLYQFTAIDDCTRIRVLKVYDRCNQAGSENVTGVLGTYTHKVRPERRQHDEPLWFSISL